MDSTHKLTYDIKHYSATWHKVRATCSVCWQCFSKEYRTQPTREEIESDFANIFARLNCKPE